MNAEFTRELEKNAGLIGGAINAGFGAMGIFGAKKSADAVRKGADTSKSPSSYSRNLRPSRSFTFDNGKYKHKKI